MRDIRRLAAVMIAMLCVVCAPSGVARAQTGASLNHLDDASTPARGLLRVRAATAWTRYHARFGANGVEPLGAVFAADTFGARTFPPLTEAEELVKTVSGAPFALSLGRARVNAEAREDVIPLTFEYGVTDRFAVGLIVPVIRKRIAAQLVLDTLGSPANMGPNQRRTNASAQQADNLVQTQFASAASQLQTRLAFCQANPSSTGCPALLARQTEAQQLIQTSQSFATAVAALYGSDTNQGLAFVPMTSSAAQGLVAARVADFNARYKDLLATPTDLLVAVPRGAAGPAGAFEFQNYLVHELGGHEIGIKERVGYGDVEIGARYVAIDRPRGERARGTQLTLASSLRLPTGSHSDNDDVMDMRFGSGALVLASRAFLDYRKGWFGLLTSGEVAQSLHDNNDADTPTHDTRWMSLDVAPRWHISEPLSVHLAYSLRTTNATGSDQLLGGGISFTTLSSYAPEKSLPIEMRYTHLETISGNSGRARFFREQIEMRIYFRIGKP